MIKDFVKQIQTKLNTTSADAYFKKTSQIDNYVLFNVEIFDKSWARVDGHIVMDIRYSDIMQLLTVTDEMIASLDNWTYSNTETSAQVDFTILNDLSSIPDEQYYNELRFEFILRWGE